MRQSWVILINYRACAHFVAQTDQGAVGFAAKLPSLVDQLDHLQRSETQRPSRLQRRDIHRSGQSPELGYAPVKASEQV